MIFGPSDTQDWLRCPVYRDLKKKWTVQDEQWTPNLLLGTALHACMAAFYRGEEALPAGVMELAKGYVEQDKWPYPELEAILKKSYAAAVPHWEAIKATETIVGIECHLLPGGDKSHTRADLVSRGADGLIVTDLKFSLRVNPEYRLRNLSEFDSSFQLWCYAYWTQKMFEEPVAWLRVQQAIGTPKAVSTLGLFKVSPKRLQFWERGALDAWDSMTREQFSAVGPAPNWTSCHGKYGKCVFYAACHDCCGDEAMMEVIYQRREPLLVNKGEADGISSV